jgi:hypothetical protein
MQDDEQQQDDLEESVHELMDEYDLDERQAKKVERLEDEGYDEEDAVAQAMDDVDKV